MIKYGAIMLFFTLSSTAIFGQDIPIGKIYVNGFEFKDVNSNSSFFQFTISDTVLTNASIEYLNNFGRFYSDNILNGNKYFIKWDNGSLGGEQKDVDLSIIRLMIVAKYLEVKFDIRGIRARCSEWSTITCDAFLSSSGNCLLR